MALKVNWFIPVNHRNYDQMLASTWIRCLQLIPYLEERGVRCTVNRPDTKADIAIFVRWQDEQAYELAKHQKQKGRPVIFDLVVNYFDETDVPYVGSPVTKTEVDECLRMVSLADVVTCASANIAQRAAQFHSWVEYLPDSVDRRHFRYNKSPEDFFGSTLRAIWSGIVHKVHELEPLSPVLKRHGIKLTIISNKPTRLRVPGRLGKRRFRTRFIPWRYETFPKRILEGEICVVHRPVDNPYNQGHSLFKIGVMLAQGIPAIVSPVPSYQEVVKNGACGRICYSIPEWEETLAMILTDRDILVRWSQQGQEAMEPYWTENVTARYFALFEHLRAWSAR